MHAVALARELSIPRVLIPARPGMTNALGCLVADMRQDLVNTVNKALDDVDVDQVHEIFRQQIERGLKANAEERSEIVATEVRHALEMQFRGQTHLLTVQVADPNISKAELYEIFATAYFDRFAVQLPEIRPVLVNIMTSVIGKRRPVSLSNLLDPAARAANVGAAQTGARLVYFDGNWLETPIYAREALPFEAAFDGPAVIEQMDTTIVVQPGIRGQTDDQGNIILDVPLI